MPGCNRNTIAKMQKQLKHEQKHPRQGQDGGFNSELVEKNRPRVEPLLNVSHSWSCGPPVSPQWNLNQTFNANVAHKEQFAQDGPNAVARTL